MLLFSKSRAGFYRWTCSITFRRGVLSKRYGKRIGTLLSVIFIHSLDRSGYECLVERVDILLDSYPSPAATGTAAGSIFPVYPAFRPALLQRVQNENPLERLSAGCLSDLSALRNSQRCESFSALKSSFLKMQ